MSAPDFEAIAARAGVDKDKEQKQAGARVVSRRSWQTVRTGGHRGAQRTAAGLRRRITTQHL